MMLKIFNFTFFVAMTWMIFIYGVEDFYYDRNIREEWVGAEHLGEFTSTTNENDLKNQFRIYYGL